MKNLKILFSLLFFTLQTFAFAQKKNNKKTVERSFPPPIVKPMVEKKPEFKTNSFLKILMNADNRHAFSWEIDADTTLVKNSVFKELLDFSCDQYSCSNVNFITSSTGEDSTFKKISKIKKGDEITAHSIFQQQDSFTFKIDKDILTLVNEKNKIIKLKIFLDKSKKNIKMLQDIKTKRIYNPSEPYYAPPSM